MRIAENLAGLIIDLHDQYGTAFPRPKGSLIQFHVVDNATTYQKAKANLEALLLMHGLQPINLTIKPGPEVQAKLNRDIYFVVPKSFVT